MIKKKKLLAIMLAVILVFSFDLHSVSASDMETENETTLIQTDINEVQETSISNDEIESDESNDTESVNDIGANTERIISTPTEESIDINLSASKELRYKIKYDQWLKVGWRSSNTSIISCSNFRWSTDIIDNEAVYESLCTVKGRQSGNADIVVYDIDTNEILHTFNVTVLPYSYSVCVNKEVSVYITSIINQGYTISADKNGLVSAVRKSISSTNINGYIEYTYEYSLKFSDVADYAVTFKGTFAGDVNISINVQNHFWKNDYTIDQEPSCTKTGSKSIHCSMCGAIKTNSSVLLEASGHTIDSQYAVDLKPTCTDKGTQSKHCITCGIIIDGTEMAVDELGHEAGSWQLVIAATTENEGVEKIYCTRCSTELDSRTIPIIKSYIITLDYNGMNGIPGTGGPVQRIVKEENKIINLDFVDTMQGAVNFDTNGHGFFNRYYGGNKYVYFNNYFDGWNSERDGSGIRYENSSEYSKDESITLYAQYKQDHKDIGNLNDPIPSEYEHYIFSGWYAESVGGEKVDLSSVDKFYDGQTFYAHWEKIKPVLSATELILEPGQTYTFEISANIENYDSSDLYAGRWTSEDNSTAWVEADNVLHILNEGDIRVAYTAMGETVYCNVSIRGLAYRLYENMLGRKPDKGGLFSWSRALVYRTNTGAEVAEGFVMSEELKKQNLSNEEFINRLYRAFLNRSPDASGKAAWVKQLDAGVTRRSVFKGFVESVEFSDLCKKYGIERGYVELREPMDQNDGVTKFVARCYRLCLGRNADSDGLNGWCRQILNKANTAKEAAHGFVFSKEFEKKNLTNEEFVKILYRVFMDREGDHQGVQAWIKVLQSGKDREHVFNGFADSVEFKKICAGYGI